MSCRLPQPLQVPLRVPLRTEEVSPHVVVNTDNVFRAAIEEADKLRTDISPLEPITSTFMADFQYLLSTV